MGTLQALSAVDLGTRVVAEAVKRAGTDPAAVDEVIMGNVLSAGLGQNPARQAALRASIPNTVSALTINKVCGSGLKAVTLAAQGIQVGDIELAVAGGMESMTNAPHLLLKARAGLRLGNGELVDSMVHDGLWDVYHDYHMGCTGELVAEKFSATRLAQDEFALSSHRRASEAMAKGFFEAEIVAVQVPRRKQDPLQFRVDEGPRPDSNIEGLSRLRPVFQKDGTVTAGNASQISDGASALVVAGEQAVRRHSLQPMARIVATATAGVAPEMVMMAPQYAIAKVLERAGWTDSDVDLYEVNEAFASQAVALCQEIPLDSKRLNVHGGAIALGHPIGASGARVLTTLLYALKQRGARKGVASLCLGGGNGVAMAVELS